MKKNMKAWRGWMLVGRSDGKPFPLHHRPEPQSFDLVDDCFYKQNRDICRIARVEVRELPQRKRKPR